MHGWDRDNKVKAISPSTISISASTNQFYKMTKISLLNDENNLTQKWKNYF